jgi:hypothetical protein
MSASIIFAVQWPAFLRNERKVDGFVDFPQQVISRDKVFYVDCLRLDAFVLYMGKPSFGIFSISIRQKRLLTFFVSSLSRGLHGSRLD